MAQHDTRLLFSVPGINAYHIQDGSESSLTPSGPQTLSLLMVPSRSPAGDKSAGGVPEDDFYLHLNLPPELDLPLPATTQIYHQPPRSYLIPRWDLGPDNGAFTRIEFPPLGRGVQQDDIDTFETILAQCTAFLEREPAPKKGAIAYNPQDYKPGENYALGTGAASRPAKGQIVLVDEENGSVVGELADQSTIVEDPALNHGKKDPVEITVSADGKRIEVRPLSDEYLSLARMPAYQKSSLVQNAAAASRLIVTTSSTIANALTSQAENFSAKTQPAKKPVVFAPASHDRARKINNFTAGAAQLSSKTVTQIANMTQNMGAKLARRGEASSSRAKDDNYKPGLLNKSMIAFTTLADGIATGGKHILESGGAATTHVVGHRYGDDARKITSELTTGVTNVGLVYIDVTGVSRRAIIKSVAKGMIVGKCKDGRQVVVGGGDGGELPPGYVEGQKPGSSSVSLSGAGQAAPPGYSPGDYKPSGGSEKYH